MGVVDERPDLLWWRQGRCLPYGDQTTFSALDELVVTDTIPLSAAAAECKTIRQLSVAEILAETMRRIAEEESVSSLYVD